MISPSSPSLSSPYPQPPLNTTLPQPVPDQKQNGKSASSLPSPDFSIPLSPKDSFSVPSPGSSSSPSSAPPSSPFSLPPMNGPAGMGSPSAPGAPGASKLPEVTVIGPDPAKNNTNHSWKAIALYGAALLATILAVRHFWPKLRGRKKAKATPATT